MKNYFSNMTKNKWIVFGTWSLFCVLLVIVVILSSITTSIPYLDTENGKILISVFGFFFFLSLITAVMTTVIIGYIEKRKTKKGEK